MIDDLRRSILQVRCAAVRLAALLLLGAAASSFAAPPFEDSMGQRMLACTGCHGPEGRAAPDGYYPRIAGKPDGYLFNQLLNFRDGRRHYALMSNLLAPLGDAYLREIANHFASLSLPYPPPAPSAQATADNAAAARLVNEGDAGRGLPACTTCHGATLTGTAPFVPGLVGLPRDYLNAQLGAWRTGQRRAHAPDCMADIARRLEPADLTAVAAWLSSQPLPAATKAVPALPRPPQVACGSASPAGPRP
jgi:cytochrome c553